MDSKYDAVVLSGGGSKGLLTLGALHYEYEKGRFVMDHVKIYAGTSIGSVICLLLICGYSPMEIFTEVYKNDRIFEVGESQSIWDVVKFMGLMSIKGFSDRIEEMVKSKLGKIPTLLELRKMTGKTLVISVANITKMKCEYFTHKTRPDLGCVNAVKLSSNLPLIFQRIRYNDSYMTDGGLMDNFPLKYIDDGKMKILGIVTMGSDFSLPDNQFMGYFYRLLVMPMNANTELRCNLAKSNTNLVKLEFNNAPLFQFTMSSEHKMEMFIHGFNEAEREHNTIYLFIKGWSYNIHDIVNDDDLEFEESNWSDELDFAEANWNEDLIL